MHWILMLTLLQPICSASYNGPTWLSKEEVLCDIKWTLEERVLPLGVHRCAHKIQWCCPTYCTDLPEKPSIQCFSTSYGSPVNCTWKLESETHLDTTFITTYRHGIDGEEQECVQPSTGGNTCSITDVQLFSILPYILNVTAVNPLGSKTNLSPFLMNQIIKPDPPEDLKVSAVQGVSHRLRLDWKPPSSWLFPEYFPLKYVIRYSRDGTNSSKTTRPSEQTSFILTGIRPGATYYAQVAAKDYLDDGKFSSWSSPASGTPWMPE